ncbi:MAG TPA: DNA replication/repair protein RecF [Caulobacteraceae bacterium]|nr:DNA replication/repair protein RecF [Caulobacteraceae bacterium]
MRARLTRLTLTDFRSYRQESLETAGRTAFLFGPNGAGKTNLLEAISLFSPGRGLRGAGADELGRRERADAEPKPWAIAVDAEVGDQSIHLGMGVASETGVRRVARVAGEPAPVSAFADYVRPIWLTPAHDRLFSGPAGDRRRFLDRLVLSAAPGHGSEAAAYEHALRERSRLLAEARADPTWLDALEARAAASGARIAVARAGAVRDIAAEIDARGEGPFPAADVSLACRWSAMAADGASEAEIEARLAQALAASRARDGAAGRALTGPHRADLEVASRESGRPAALSSTGEQKALILNLILAQAARLSRAISTPNPILLLDEAAAHLDAGRRAALFDEIEALALQAFLTGADESLFETLKGRALAVRVDDSKLTPLDENG